MSKNKRIIRQMVGINQSNDIPYMRPFLCNGDINKSKIFLVGINPATPIYPYQIDLENYIDLINDYDSFMNFYMNSRKERGNTGISRTRQGINAFSSMIIDNLDITIIETDIYAYPTKNIKELKSISTNLLKKSNDIFFEVLKVYTPKIIILYGSMTLKTFLNNIIYRNINACIDDLSNKRIEDIEKDGLYGSININGVDIKVFACRHFMYYGKKGKSYSNFNNNILKFLSNNI